jgi:hypothetical protein
MINVDMFKSLGDIIVSNKTKRNTEYQEFLVFYRGLVESLPTEACNSFGSLSVVGILKKERMTNYSILLTAGDFLWWKNMLANPDFRFEKTITEIKQDMLNRMAKLAEVQDLEPDGRKKLLALLLNEGNV